jgi:hypothetical protein
MDREERATTAQTKIVLILGKFIYTNIEKKARIQSAIHSINQLFRWFSAKLTHISRFNDLDYLDFTSG